MFVCRYINENGVFFGSGSNLDEAAHDMMDSNPEIFDGHFAEYDAIEFFALVDTRVDTRVTWRMEEDYQESWED